MSDKNAAPPVVAGDVDELMERVALLDDAEALPPTINLICDLRDALAAKQAERAQARLTLAHTDIGSLPNDWTLQQIAEARIDDLLKLRDQVRDTCRRAEAAQARIAVLTEALTLVANRLDWLMLELSFQSRALSDCVEWCDEARAAIKGGENE